MTLPTAGAPPDKPLESKPTVGLILLTVLWAWVVIVDGPLLVRLAFVGERATAQVLDCKEEQGSLCRVRTPTGQEALLRNSLLASYKPGTTIDVRLLPGRPDTLRAEGQIVRSTAMRLVAALVLAALWLRLWGKSQGPLAPPPVAR